MHVALCVNTFPARSETFVVDHAMGLRSAGHQVTVVAAGIGDGICREEVEALDGMGIARVYQLSTAGRFKAGLRALAAVAEHPSFARSLKTRAPWDRQHLLNAFAIAKLIRKMKPDVVHVHFGTLGSQLQMVSRCVGNLPPMIVTWHGYDANVVTKTRGDDIYEDLFDANCRHTVGSDFMRERLLQLGASPEAVTVVPMGIDIEKFFFSARKFHPGEAFRILSVGRLDEVKGHQYLIDAVKLLRSQKTPVSLRIVGEGPLRDSLKRRLDIDGLHGTVVLLGALASDQVVSEMHAAHVFAMTGVTARSGAEETQGVVFAEAQATGLPVIASRIGGVPDSVIDGRTGVLCPPKNVTAVASALEFFIRSPAEIGRFGKRGREFAEAFFSRAAMIESFSRVYRQLKPHE